MSEQPATDQRGGDQHGVDAVAEAYVETWAASDPYGATSVGIAGHDHETSDLSPEGFARRLQETRETWRAVDGLTPTDDRERIAQLAMTERLSSAVAYAEAGLERSLNVLASPLQEVRQVFSLMPTRTAADWDAVAERLVHVPSALDGYRRTLCSEIEEGRPPALRQVLACQQQCGRLADGFFTDLVQPALQRAESEVGAQEAARVLAAAKEAEHAFGTFEGVLDGMTARATTEDACGPEVYRIASQFFLGAQVDVHESYAWGFEELARLEAEMSAAGEQVAPGAGLEGALDALDADPARRLHGAEVFVAWMQDLSDRALDSLAGTHFEIPDAIRSLECRLAPQHDGGIYYTGPSEDLSRPGRMWWSVPEETTTFHTWREMSTVFHEGVPGHHLQIGQTMLRTDELNRWQRLLCWVSGHGEGWALYAERLMGELGWLEDPGDRLGMLDLQRFRAARVCVDIGLHCGFPVPERYVEQVGPRWSADGVLRFMRAHSRHDEPMLRAEVNRYLGWPGQAPSYKLGERLWLRARAEAKANQGADFDLKRFHDHALGLGAMGLDPLRVALETL